MLPGRDGLYHENYNFELLKADYPKGQRRPLADKYHPTAIENVICEVDLKVPKGVVERLLATAKCQTYKQYYELLDLAKADGLDSEDMDWILQKFAFLSPHVFGSVFHRMHPGQLIMPHVDPIRQTSIYLPLRKKNEPYTPLEIYYDNKIFGVGDDDNQSFFSWNTKNLHGVYNRSPFERFNFQLLVNLPYKESLALIKENLGIRSRKDSYLTYDVKRFFSQYVDHWEGKKILDWGCGPGNFLQFNNSETLDYHGCDIDPDLISELRRQWPDHKFTFYNKYNRQYGHRNSLQGPWPLTDEKFDIIICFSVCTHIDLNEIKQMVQALKTHLSPEGQLLLSFFDNKRTQSWTDIVQYRYEYFTPEHKNLWSDIASHNISYVAVDLEGEVHLEQGKNKASCKDSQYFVSFFDGEFLAQEINGVLLKPTQTFNSKIMDGQRCIQILPH